MKTFLQTLLALFLIVSSAYAQTNFWCTSEYGGVTGFGSVFKTNGDGTNPIEVYAFTGGVDGGNPTGGLIKAANGKLYGVTYGGGTSGDGVLFEIDPGTGNFTKLADFNGAGTGSQPRGTLCEATDGKLYGFTYNGGTSNYGTLFSYEIAGNTLTKIIDFTVATGRNPGGNTLMQASNGKLYGTLPNGGIINNGTLIEYDLITTQLTVLVNFQGPATGIVPRCKLLETSPGILYGTTASGGINGTIFQYDINADSLTTKINFDYNTVGSTPYMGMIKASNGLLYGMTLSGGMGFSGTMYEYDPVQNIFTNIIDFGLLDTGAIYTFEPRGLPVEGSNGKIYSTSTFGCNDGNVFEYDYNTGNYQITADLSVINGGGGPVHVQLLEIPTEPADIWPGDANYDLTANNLDILAIGQAYGNTGPVRPGATTNWTAQACPMWSTLLPSGINNRHADTNGDGVVDASDTTAVSLNYGQTHPFRPIPQVLSGAGQLELLPTAFGVGPGQPITYFISLSSVAAPINALYGVAFDVSFDPAKADVSTTTADFSSSVLGTVSVDLLPFHKNEVANDRIAIATTRTDHNDLFNVYGLLGSFTIYAAASVSTATNLLPVISNIVLTTAGGQEFTLTPKSNPVLIDPALSGIVENENQALQIYPSPANQYVTITHQYQQIEKIRFTDITGKVCLEMRPGASSIQIDVSSLENGVYLVAIDTDTGTRFSKVVIRH